MPKDDIEIDKSEENLDDSVVAEEHAGDAVKKMREKLKACETEKQEFLTGWQRSKADFVNFRKDQEKSQKEFVKFAQSGLVEDLIPVLDSFELAMGNREAWEKADKNWRVGVEYIHSQLTTILEGNGLQAITPKIGDVFDHNEHEAVESIPVEDEKQNDKIVTLITKGYRLNGRILRPARVKVGEKK